MKVLLFKYPLTIVSLLLLQFLAFYLLMSLGVTRNIDFHLYGILLTYKNTQIYDFFMTFSHFSGTFASLVVFTILFTILVKLQYFKDALWIVLFAFTSVFGTLFFKYLLQVPRPLHSIHGLTGYSFPSGHVVLSILLSISLSILLRKCIHKKRIKYPLNALILFYLLFSTFARVIICSHWLSDVIASFLAMLLFLSITVVVFEKIKELPMYKKHITQ